ncbi:MAG: aminotransferase class V-fold PLP-dependent enzyme [bacterium]|nr:aminotransferase class V-fold PLP-dependent enzyme [Bacillota bacterium]HHW54136.1 aminotransferase class V-fold PLP-dependent enzyme [Bacillota bacterium]
MQEVYLDNGATSYPKAPGVGEAVKHFLDDIGSNVNRSGYAASLAAEEIVFETRERLCRLFNFGQPENVIFTLNVTQALNYLIKGLLQPGDHCIVSSMEHNAVMRPLMQLKKRGVEFSRLQCDERGRLDPGDLYPLIKANTKAVIINHASNVCGTVLPVAEIGKICAERGLRFIVDTAQTAGILDIDFQKIRADALAFTGHKGLLGPQGTGGFLLSPELARTLEPLISGGTGSLSEQEEPPPYLPDKFEAGTLNLPGIFGLHAALAYIEKTGTGAIRKKELELAALLLEGLSVIGEARLVGLEGLENRTAVVSVDFPGYDNAEIAYLLDRDYGIKTRCGLHCAPAAHKTLGTFPRGTVRLSPGHFNTREEIEYTLSSIHKVLKAL